MTLSVTSFGDNAQIPGISAEAYIPDQLIAGNLKLVTDNITLTGASALARGAVLGKTVTAGTGAATAGTNTGNGVMGAITVAGPAIEGTYSLKITKVVTNAGDFELYDPRGRLVGVGSAAAAFSGGGLAFTLADGSADFAVGDSFSIVVAVTTEKYKLAALAATDGSQTPVAILADAADPSGGDVSAPIYIMGEFNSNALTLGTGITATSAKAALGPLGMFLKGSVSAADPT